MVVVEVKAIKDCQDGGMPMKDAGQWRKDGGQSGKSRGHRGAL
jgi:hypothetical protein